MTRFFRPLQIGPLRIWPPVLLAPMAGVTNYPFRSLCRDFGAPLCVGEMITARPLAENCPKTWRLAAFGPEEAPRSLQLYGVDPLHVARAVERLAAERRVDHIDLNFGCPVAKVTRRGGGAAIALRPTLLGAIVRAAVRHAEAIPVTIKCRLGIDDEHLTYLEAGRVAGEEGCAAVTLHARTAAQLYDGQARWEHIRELKTRLRAIPVIGNGDIWEASDALRMMQTTGCDAVAVGRGSLGRPWLFRDLARAFENASPIEPPLLGEVLQVMHEHARRLSDWIGQEYAMRAFRRQAAWYTKGFRLSRPLRERLVRVRTLDELRAATAGLDPSEPFPPHALRLSRGKRSGRQKVALPEAFLTDDEVIRDAESAGVAEGG